MRWSKSLNIISSILFVGTLIVWLLSHGTMMNPAFVGAGSYHFEAINGWLCAWHGGTGPYSGGGILYGPGGVEIKAVTSSGRFMGIFFVQYWRPAPYGSCWTVMLPLYYPLAISAVLPAVWFVRRRVDRRNRQPHGFPVS